MLELTNNIGGWAEELRTVAVVDVMKAGVSVFIWREGEREQRRPVFLDGGKWKAYQSLWTN